MDKVGQYIEYNGKTYICVAFDGVNYWLVEEERIEKSNQIFNQEMFTLVSEEDLEDENEL